MGKDTLLQIPRVDDFKVTGTGVSSAWDRAEWQVLQLKGSCGAEYQTRTKVLYSDSGIYLLADCEDKKITSTGLKDNDHLYNEDVVEFFLWPEESQILYFEYEISPLGAQLPILVAKNKDLHHGWLPWVYEKGRLIHRAVDVRGGPKEPGAPIEGWSAEVYIPFELFKGLGNMPPRPGTRWRANMYRIDYDKQPTSHWVWSPIKGKTFHDYESFGTFVFE